jgi:hypothetical protein
MFALIPLKMTDGASTAMNLQFVKEEIIRHVMKNKDNQVKFPPFWHNRIDLRVCMAGQRLKREA